MNANELADYLQNKAEVELQPRLQESATMLRQQQAEIEALKSQLNPYQSITDTKIEPTVVSYTHPAKEHFEDEPQAEELHEIMQSNAELTDEEIAVIGDKCFGTMSYELWLQTNEFARAILRKAGEKCNGFCGEYECKENQSICKRKAQ